MGILGIGGGVPAEKASAQGLSKSPTNAFAKQQRQAPQGPGGAPSGGIVGPRDAEEPPRDSEHDARETPPAVAESGDDAAPDVSSDDPDDEDDQAKIENIDEFRSSVQEFTEAHAFGSTEEDLLTAFLDHVALVSDTDALSSKQSPFRALKY